MKLEVGIYEKGQGRAGNIGGWKIVCEQEKIPHKVTNKPDCPVMVFDGETPDWLEGYMSNGGVCVVTDCLPVTLPFETEFIADASIEYADFTELNSSVARVQCLAGIFAGDGLGKIKLHENRKRKFNMNPDEYPVFLYQSCGEGGCWYTGLPLSRLLNALGDTLRSSSSFIDYTERIVSVDKHHIISAMRSILIKSFHTRGLPYVHLWYYPRNYQSVFTFRIDIDGVFGDHLAQISKAAKDHDLKLTFFANKNLCETDESRLKEIDPMHEIGNHANIHNLYSEYSSNLKNVLECKEWLDQLGIENGPWFVAPRGMWNYHLGEALEDLGYLYSSDFGLSIEGFPFFPYLRWNRSKTMQIPVNPFSAERAAIWKREVEDTFIDPGFVSDFFSKVIKDHYSRCVPIMLYSHPEEFGKMADYVFHDLCLVMKDLNVWKTTLSEFAQWWIRRDHVEYSAEYDEVTKKVSISGRLDEDMDVREVFE